MGENFRLRCSKCESPFRAPPAAAGKKVKCPHCQAPVQVPAAASDDKPSGDKPAPAKKPQPQPARKESLQDKATARAAPAKPEPKPELRVERPRPQPMKRQRPSQLPANLKALIISGVVLCIVAVGGYCAYPFGYPYIQKWQEAQKGTAEASSSNPAPNPPTHQQPPPRPVVASPSTPPVRPVAGGTALTWVAAQTDNLAEEHTIKTYHYHPPKGFALQNELPRAGITERWTSQGVSETSLVVSIIDCEDSEDLTPSSMEVNTSFEGYIADTFPGTKVTDKKVGHGQVEGEPFIRVEWSGTDPKGRSILGVTYLVYYKSSARSRAQYERCALTATEPAEKKSSDLALAEASIRSFKR